MYEKVRIFVLNKFVGGQLMHENTDRLRRIL